MNKILKEKKGVAGLNVYLSLIAMLFMIGVIVMVFQIAGGKLAESIRDTGTTGSKVNETITNVTETGKNLAVYSLRDVACTISVVTNRTSGTIIPASNYTQTNCNLKYKAGVFNNTAWNVSYTYTYTADNGASEVINETRSSIQDATDFFPTFIVLGAMVVLVLLVVIIINSIRATGITQEGA